MSRLRRDGVALFYEEAGVGEPPMLLVHGIACDHTHLTPQLEHFSDDHRVVAVDLRGHGQSDAPQQEYSIEGFADDLAWVCARLGLENPVVVGHSLGGRIGLARCRECKFSATGFPPSGVLGNCGAKREGRGSK